MGFISHWRYLIFTRPALKLLKPGTDVIIQCGKVPDVHAIAVAALLQSKVRELQFAFPRLFQKIPFREILYNSPTRVPSE